MKTVSHLAIGMPLYCGPSEYEEYRKARDEAGFVMEWIEAPDWGIGAMKGIRCE